MNPLTPHQLTHCTGGTHQFPPTATDLAYAADQQAIEDFLAWWFRQTMTEY